MARVINRILVAGIPMSIVCREEHLDLSNVRNWVAKHTSMNPSDMTDETKRSTMTADDWKNEQDKLEKAHKRALLELEIVKKLRHQFTDALTGDRIRLIRYLHPQYTIRLLCVVFQVTRQAYYHWLQKQRELTLRDQREISLCESITAISTQHRMVYGSGKYTVNFANTVSESAEIGLLGSCKNKGCLAYESRESSITHHIRHHLHCSKTSSIDSSIQQNRTWSG
jgi:hypothetical protein